MIAIIGFFVIVACVYFFSKLPSSPPPKIVDPMPDSPEPKYKYFTEDDDKADYDENHFWSVKHQCWVRLENGVFYRSVPFEEWDFDPEADNGHIVVYPEEMMTREEYEADEEAAADYERHRFL